jgi:formate hydrogenlyase subunit 4
MDLTALVPPLLPLVLAPLLLGIINRTKAFFAGRAGPSLFQPYYDLRKLFLKGAVYSRTTTWIFRAGPLVSLAALILASTLVPFGGLGAPLQFSGDLLLFAYLLALARWATVLAALDTGSSFEGMGASRELLFSALAEPALLLSIAAIAREVAIVAPEDDYLSLSGMHRALDKASWPSFLLIQALVAVALAVVFLAENCRIPVDDPNTHLELTMIHEVMVLDHSGPDFAFILYGTALKLWILAALLLGFVLPRSPYPGLSFMASCLGMLILAVLVGVVESVMARLRLVRVPQLLVGATTFSALALILEYGRTLS